MAASINGGGIYISKNYGSTWIIASVSSGFPSSLTWKTLALNYAGTQLVAVAGAAGVFKSIKF
jgi:hypothetical protein